MVDSHMGRVQKGSALASIYAAMPPRWGFKNFSSSMKTVEGKH